MIEACARCFFGHGENCRRGVAAEARGTATCISLLTERIAAEARRDDAQPPADAERESAAGVRLGIEMARKRLYALADEWGETALERLNAANDQAVGVPEWHAEVHAALSAAARRDELQCAADAIGETPTQGGAVIRADELADERDLIGAILIDPGAYEIAAEIVEASDFGGPENAAIFRACAAIRERGGETDATAVRAELMRTGKLAEAGGDRYIASAICGLPRTLPTRELAERVKTAAKVDA